MSWVPLPWWTSQSILQLDRRRGHRDRVRAVRRLRRCSQSKTPSRRRRRRGDPADGPARTASSGRRHPRVPPRPPSRPAPNCDGSRPTSLRLPSCRDPSCRRRRHRTPRRTRRTPGRELLRVRRYRRVRHRRTRRRVFVSVVPGWPQPVGRLGVAWTRIVPETDVAVAKLHLTRTARSTSRCRRR